MVNDVGSEKLVVPSLKSGDLDCAVKGEDLSNLPNVARDVLQMWELIQDLMNAAANLMDYIISLEECSSNREVFVESMPAMNHWPSVQRILLSGTLW